MSSPNTVFKASTNPGIPPRLTDGVLIVSGSTLVDAPKDRVWRVLTDLDSYTKWNPFVRKQVILDLSSKPLSITDQTLTSSSSGKIMVMDPVHLPPTLGRPTKFFQKQKAVVRVTCVDAENYRLAWCTAGPMPRFLLYAERWQALTVEQGEDGRERTKYESVEVFCGLLVYVIRLIMRGRLVEGVKGMGEGLKREAEASS